MFSCHVSVYIAHQQTKTVSKAMHLVADVGCFRVHVAINRNKCSNMLEMVRDDAKERGLNVISTRVDPC